MCSPTYLPDHLPSSPQKGGPRVDTSQVVPASDVSSASRRPRPPRVQARLNAVIGHATSQRVAHQPLAGPRGEHRRVPRRPPRPSPRRRSRSSPGYLIAWPSPARRPSASSTRRPRRPRRLQDLHQVHIIGRTLRYTVIYHRCFARPSAKAAPRWRNPASSAMPTTAASPTNAWRPSRLAAEGAGRVGRSGPGHRGAAPSRQRLLEQRQHTLTGRASGSRTGE